MCRWAEHRLESLCHKDQPARTPGARPRSRFRPGAVRHPRGAFEFVQEGAQLDLRAAGTEGAIHEAESLGLAAGERATGFDERGRPAAEPLPQAGAPAEAGEAGGEAEVRQRRRDAQAVIAGERQLQAGAEARAVDERHRGEGQGGQPGEHALPAAGERGAVGHRGHRRVQTRTEAERLRGADHQGVQERVALDRGERGVEFGQTRRVEGVHRVAGECQPERADAVLGRDANVCGLEEHPGMFAGRGREINPNRSAEQKQKSFDRINRMKQD